MKLKNFFFSLICLFAAVFFIILGAMALLIPWSPSVRTDIIFLVLEGSKVMILFGIGSFLLGFALVFHVLLGGRRRYYHIKGGDIELQVDASILQEYVNKSITETFPNSDIPSQLTLRNNKVHITTDLPYVPFAQQEMILVKLRNDIEYQLKKYIGYRHPFTLSASFQKSPKEE